MYVIIFLSWFHNLHRRPPFQLLLESHVFLSPWSLEAPNIPLKQ